MEQPGSEPADPNTLAYGRQARRFPKRLAALAGLAAVIAAAGWLSRDRFAAIVQNMRAARLERACMEYALAADVPILVQGPGSDTSVSATDYDWTNDTWVRHAPPAWQSLSAQCFRRSGPDRLVFLHGRRTTAGDDRLVAVRIDARPDAADRGRRISFLGGSFTVGSATAPPRQVAPGLPYGVGLLAARLRVDDDFVVYSGQPDPADASRFHVPYRMGRHLGTIECVAQDDGGIRFTPDEGTVTARNNGGLTVLEWVPPDGPPN